MQIIRRYWITGILTALLLSSQSYCQSGTGNEFIYVHIDRSVYVAGEAIQFKAYFTDGEGNPGCSQVLYFNLAGEKEDLNWRINIDSRAVSGYLDIPDSIEAGVYKFSAYTNVMRNTGSGIFGQNLLILNLTTEIPDTIMIPDAPVSGMFPGEDKYTAFLKASVSKDSYVSGEIIRLKLELENVMGECTGADLSVSVSPVHDLLNLLGETDIRLMFNQGSYNYTPEKTKCIYKTEDKGYILSGKVVDRLTNTPVPAKNVLLSVADSIKPHVLISLTDESGFFRFYPGRDYDNQDLILQLAQPDANCMILIDNKDPGELNDLSSLRPYILNPEESGFLNSVKDIRIIESIFRERTFHEIPVGALGGSNLLGIPDQVLFPRDYVPLVNFKELSSNIMPYTKFTTRKDRHNLYVLSPLNVYKESYTVLLNGVPFNDLAYISTLGTQEIERIDVYKPNIMMGDFTFYGLVSIYTYDRVIPERFMQSNTVIFGNTVMPVDTVETAKVRDISSRYYPDFLNTLYWNPSVTIGAGSKHDVIEFPAQLLTGKYNVRINGLTDNGIPVNETISFIIKE